MSKALEVWIDCDLVPMKLVGMLHHDKGQVRFHYAESWLKSPEAFALDPQLSLDKSPFYPNAEEGNFGIFLDSSPDRWGQTLMKRREALQAKDEGKVPANLYAWDFLIGVQDATRQGALRFRMPGTETFLGDMPLAAPPVTSLRELQAVAFELTNKSINDLGALRRWLAVLVAPGASLGGARPKANFTEADGSMWIAKFPARDDERDYGAWEYLTHTLAARAGIDVPPARAVQITKPYKTFMVKRFDRIGDRRRFYASALTLLGRPNSDGASYLEIAQRLMSNGSHASGDLEQLYRRVAFNVMVGNRDDHLRNHGFILDAGGWRLSPAFDVNPNIDKEEHVLAIDDKDPRPLVETVLDTHAFYQLDATRAREIVLEIAAVVGSWRELALGMGISRADIELYEAAFSAHTAFMDEAPVQKMASRRRP